MRTAKDNNAMAAAKKIPQRSCVVCRTKRDKKDLLRVVLTPDGDIKFDPTGRVAGRGSYLCRNEECIKAELKKSGKLAKGLRHQVTSEELSSLAKDILEQAAKAQPAKEA